MMGGYIQNMKLVKSLTGKDFEFNPGGTTGKILISVIGTPVTDELAKVIKSRYYAITSESEVTPTDVKADIAEEIVDEVAAEIKETSVVEKPKKAKKE